MTRARKSGRYDRVEEALHPGGEFLPEGKRGAREIAHAAVVEPGEARAYHLQNGKRQRAMVNIANDPLEREHRWGRISDEAYAAGRAYQAVMEAARIGAGPAGMERGCDGCGDHDAMMAKVADRVRAAVALDGQVRSNLGAWAAMLLRGVLVDGNSTKQIAARNGRASKAARAGVLAEFREALEGLVDVIEDAT